MFAKQKMVRRLSNDNESLLKTMRQEPASDGELANLFVLKNKQGMSLTLMDIGATWLSCEIPVENSKREILLGVSSMADHLRQNVYLGATVGRFANRIANGQFSLDNKPYQLSCNQAGNCLHGGENGFDKRRWTGEQLSEQSVSFTLTSPDGDQGFPGNLQVKVIYLLDDNNRVSIEYVAITDKACPVNLTNHAYFNLMGAESGVNCLQHQLMITAEQYLPIDQTSIPLGHFKAVTPSFDFRNAKKIERDFLSCREQKMAAGYDHSFLFKQAEHNGEKAIVKCISADKKLALEIATTQPAIQLYTGNYLAGTPNRGGGEYQNYAGLALETQRLPDSPNHLQWLQPSPILKPGEQYHEKTSYQFIINN